MRTSLLAAIPLLLSACMPSGSGPNPNAVLVISSTDYSPEQVQEAIEDVRPEIDAGIDKKPDFSFYKLAYWYPQHGSDIYGVGITQWPDDLNGDDAKEMTDRYFVEVYSTEQACPLCKSTKDALTKRGIAFFSACENKGKSSNFERIRCGT